VFGEQESTFNWYWLVDGLMDLGYRVHLANPAAIQQYSGLKYTDDDSDALWLAEMLRLGILREGYIYPKAAARAHAYAALRWLHPPNVLQVPSARRSPSRPQTECPFTAFRPC
jgi:hypothetical protein